MDDLTAALLIFLLVSPSTILLFVLIARKIRTLWKTCAPSANVKLKTAMDCQVRRIVGRWTVTPVG